MKRWLLVAWLLAGCGQGLSSAALHYLKQSNSYQKSLGEHQAHLKQIPLLPTEKRGEEVRKLLAVVQRQRAELAQLKHPSSVDAFHQELSALYQLLEEYCTALLKMEQSAPPEMEKLSKQWSEHAAALQREADKLGSR